MKKLPSVINRILYPQKAVLFTVPPVIFAALVYIFAAKKNESIAAYIIYVMSAYCLTVLILRLLACIKGIKAFLRRLITGTELGRKYADDLAFRGSIGIRQGMAVNFIYVIFRMTDGIYYASVWFISIAVYHLMLGILRAYLIVCYRRRDSKTEYSCYKKTALLLFLLNVPMGGMILLMVLTDSGYTYHGYVIYLSAMYTFYAMIMSVVNLIRFRRLGSLILSAAKALNFVAALMSILGLQTAMIAQFSAGEKGFCRTMNALTGCGVWIAVIITAAYMLYRSKKIKRGDLI